MIHVFTFSLTVIVYDYDRFAPQVRVVDGRIELDLDSLTVDHATVDGVEQGPIEYVDESSTSRFVNSATFSNKFRSEKWSEDETELFYKVTFTIHLRKANKCSVSILVKHEHDRVNDTLTHYFFSLHDLGDFTMGHRLWHYLQIVSIKDTNRYSEQIQA